MCCLLFTKAPSEVPLSLGFLQAFPGTCSSMLCCEALCSFQELHPGLCPECFR